MSNWFRAPVPLKDGEEDAYVGPLSQRPPPGTRWETDEEFSTAQLAYARQAVTTLSGLDPCAARDHFRKLSSITITIDGATFDPDDLSIYNNPALALRVPLDDEVQEWVTKDLERYGSNVAYNPDERKWTVSHYLLKLVVVFRKQGTWHVTLDRVGVPKDSPPKVHFENIEYGVVMQEAMQAWLELAVASIPAHIKEARR